MKITLISQYYYPEPFSIQFLAENLAERGHDITVVTGVPNYPEGIFYPGYSNRKRRSETHQGVKILRAWSQPRGRGKLRLVLNYLTFPVTALVTLRALRKDKPDVIFVNQLSPILMCLPAIMVARRWKRPLVYWVQDLWPESATHTLGLQPGLAVKLLNRFCGWIYRQADFILTQSSAFHLRLELHGVLADRLGVLYNTVAEVKETTQPDLSTHFSSASFNIVFTGNIGESQNFDTVVDAAHLLKGVGIHWIIVGEGRDLDRIKRRIFDEGLSSQFHFPGRFPANQMGAFYAMADALLIVLKSNTVFDLTIPYKLQGYLEAGRPILGSISGEAARIISEAGAGVVAPASDDKLLAQEVRALVEAPETERQQMGENGHQYYAAHFSKDTVLNTLEETLIAAARKGNNITPNNHKSAT